MAEFDDQGNLIPGTNKVKPDEWTGAVNPEPMTINPDGRATTVDISGIGNPLKPLFTNPYAQKTLTYPRDVSRLDKGHTVQFEIKDVDPMKMSDTPFGKIGDGIGQVISLTQDKQFTSKSVTDQAEIIGGIASNTGSAIASSTVQMFNQMGGLKGLTDAKPPTTKTVSTIRLYMPDSLNFGYNAQYDKLSVAEAINSIPLVGSISKAITSFVSDNDLGKGIVQKAGYTFNPQQQTIFEGIDFREFEMEFIFTPTSRDEALAIQNIIKEFRRAAAPTKVQASGGFFWVPPSIFNISFYFNDSINKSLPPIKPCVLQNIAVNYAPNGWAAMVDGSPVQTTIALSFRELDLLDRQSIVDEPIMS